MAEAKAAARVEADLLVAVVRAAAARAAERMGETSAEAREKMTAGGVETATEAAAAQVEVAAAAAG